MKKNIWLTGMLLASLVISAQNISLTQTIKGTILDEQSGNVIGNVNVMLESNPSKGDITDSSGSFKLKNVPIGRQTLRVSLIGYEEAVIRNIEVTSSQRSGAGNKNERKNKETGRSSGKSRPAKESGR